ncbi:MAG: hypothetical protein R6V48_02690 [Fidelibacterota bacterium]
MFRVKTKKIVFLIILLALCTGACPLFAQHKNQASLNFSDNSNGSWEYCFEPAVIVNPATIFFGIYETGFSIVGSRKISSSFAISSYTGAKTLFFRKDEMRMNLRNNYHIEVNQLLGVQFYFGKDNSQSIGILGGVGFMRFKESIVNPDAGLNHTYTSPWILSPNYGVFHQSLFPLKNDASLFLRYYLPLTHRFTLMENVLSSSLEFGLQLGFPGNR